jgi:hypothetical protein
MDIKKNLLSFITQPYIVELVLSKVFKRTKRFAFEQMENALEEIKDYLIQKRDAYKESMNPYDEEVLNLGISALKEFSTNLNAVLAEIEADGFIEN